MTNPAKICAALGALLLVGCSSGPEVVATERTRVTPPMSDAAFTVQPRPSQCRTGVYNGQFRTSPGVDGGSNLIMNGDFNFELVESLMREFSVLKEDFQLQGKSPDLGIKFDATVKGGGQCVDGHFTSQLVNGHFTVMDGQPAPFEGSVEGDYYAKVDDGGGEGDFFVGEWQLNKLLGIHGGWTAIRAAQSK